MEKCLNCKYWNFIKNMIRLGEDDPDKPALVQCSVGFCHRHPPIFQSKNKNPNDIEMLDNFPLVGGDNWCGEFVFKKPEMSEIEKQPISTLNLSTRSFTALTNARIRTIGDLVKLNKRELFRIRSIGRSSLREIMRKLQDENLCLSK